MKNLLIGLGVFGVFVLYSIGVRHQSPAIGKSSSLFANNSMHASATGGAMGMGGGASTSMMGKYKDGNYKGSVADAYYGNVQVSATISGGKIIDVTFLQSPGSRSTSIQINQQAMPYLQQEAIAAQSANVQAISGATFTSEAFQQSLSSALTRAQG